MKKDLLVMVRYINSTVEADDTIGMRFDADLVENKYKDPTYMELIRDTAKTVTSQKNASSSIKDLAKDILNTIISYEAANGTESYELSVTLIDSVNNLGETYARPSDNRSVFALDEKVNDSYIEMNVKGGVIDTLALKLMHVPIVGGYDK